MKIRAVILCVVVAGIGYGCASAPPRHSGSTTDGVRRVALLGERTFPEGIAAHANTGDLFVGGVAGGEIQRVGAHGVTTFKKSRADGLINVIGLAVDSARNRLWVCSTSFDDPSGEAALIVFDTDTGARLAHLALPRDAAPHFLNDVDVDSTGRAYATDSLAPIVWTVPADLSSIEVFVRNPAFVIDPNGFNLNGLVVTPGDRYLIASVPSLSDSGRGKLFRIQLSTREVSEVMQDRPFAGADGLTVLADHRLVASGAPPGLFRIDFDAEYSAARLEPLDRFADQFAQPTTAAVSDHRLWVVNSQLDHYVVTVFGDQGPPALPFEIVGIPLSEL
ncbi:MAG TPA: hypothetical protein VJV78_03515 [Polyangiales bacterium]|nr:hypothetical protein [Polyangiales bacterium]